MGKRQIILLGIFFIYICTSSKSIDERDIRYYDSFYNSDGTQKLYLVDTLQTSEIKLILKDEYQNSFAITDTTGFNGKTNLLEYDKAFVLLVGKFKSGLCNFEMLIPLKYAPEIWDLSTESEYDIIKENKSVKVKGNKYYRAYFENPPSFYIMALIKGSMYNYATCYSIMDEYVGKPRKLLRKPLNFCNENAYYRMLIPVWKNDSCARNLKTEGHKEQKISASKCTCTKM